jgi:hypothetical protein
MATICSSKPSESKGFDGNFADEPKRDRMAYLKDEIPADIAEILCQAEARADECWRALRLRHYPADLAIWAVLTGGIRMVEGEQATRGSNTPHFDAMLANLSRLLAVAVKWAIGHGQPPADPPRRWTGELSAAVDQALELAKDYAHFEVCFQGFHKGRYAADVLSPSLIRFSVPGSERERQVSAYQKGLRPREGRFTGQRAAQRPQEPRVVEIFEQALGTCRGTGSLGFEYGDPWPLWRELMPEYKDRVTALARRADTLSLGDYTLAEFNAFYVALIVVCAAHDHLCFLWARANGVYPLESAVIVRSTAAWTHVLSRLSGLAPEKCRPMIADLTFSPRQSVDLHVYPLISLGGANDRLALAPPFPLHSRHDENILRVCSQRRPQVYDVTSLEKQSEMLATARTVGSRYGADGPVQLPNPIPDIDLLAVDESCATVVIAELKWIRKTVRPVEIPERDADVLKGVRQLDAISAFLMENTDYLRSRGLLAQRLDQYEQVHYLLVARDHWRWVEPRSRVAIVEFEPFARALQRAANLGAAVGELLTYDWLPVERRDFRIQEDRAEANGVTIQSPVFYSTAPQ